MSKEFLKMQKLAGLITENQYKGTLTEIEGDPDDYYGYNEPIDPNDYADGNPSDAVIYDALLDIDHEQLVSDMLSTAESNPSITLVKYLDKYDSSNDLNEGADGYDDEENQLADIIEDNKVALAKQFNLTNPMVSWNAEGEPVMITDDNDEQVDFIKKEDWEENKGFYNRNQGMGEITLNDVDIIYVINPY